jgi:hypothetical protein
MTSSRPCSASFRDPLPEYLFVSYDWRFEEATPQGLSITGFLSKREGNYWGQVYGVCRRLLLAWRVGDSPLSPHPCMHFCYLCVLLETFMHNFFPYGYRVRAQPDQGHLQGIGVSAQDVPGPIPPEEFERLSPSFLLLGVHSGTEDSVKGLSLR